MAQGRKSRWTTRALFCVLGALLAAAVAPPSAVAAPATEEYDLALPQADGGSSGSDADETVAPAPSTAPPTAPAPEPAAPVVADDGGGDGKARDGAGKPEDPFAPAAADRPIRNLAASDSGDGGFPALLILLGVIAATCGGVAIFRFRRSIATGAAGREMSSGTQSP